MPLDIAEETPMTKRSIIIIGGGIAGLSAGCYGQMNGFSTRIFEMHKKKPGGLCTAWKRQGYTVDGCIHWLVGSSRRSAFHKIWTDLGALEGKTIVDFDEYGRFEAADGKTFIVYANIDKLERHMKELAPEDIPVIDEFIAAARKCTRFEPPLGKAPEVMNLFDALKMLVTNFGLLRILWKWNKISLTDFGNRFKNRVLRESFPLLFMPDFPMTFMLMTFGWMHNRAAGYPIGGSLPFAQSIEKRYLSLGGEMVYKSKVIKILTENGRAVGIRLEDGTEHRADYVVSAADGHTTIFEMLEGNFVDEKIKGYYDKLIPFPPLMYIALGVNRKFPEIPPSAGLTLELKDPLVVGGEQQRFLNVHIFNFDPTLAPEGRTALVIMMAADYEYWKRLRGNEAQYKAEKERVADKVVAILDQRFPGLAGQVEMRDVASPTTFVRYTGNWKGSFEGWQVTPKTWNLGQTMRKTLPGLDNFYMAGQWVEPGGGLPAVAMSGRNVIQIICKKEKRSFLP
jgi:phytoene dehydrogenase-like protein